MLTDYDVLWAVLHVTAQCTWAVGNIEYVGNCGKYGIPMVMTHEGSTEKRKTLFLLSFHNIYSMQTKMQIANHQHISTKVGKYYMSSGGLVTITSTATVNQSRLSNENSIINKIYGNKGP